MSLNLLTTGPALNLKDITSPFQELGVHMVVLTVMLSKTLTMPELLVFNMLMSTCSHAVERVLQIKSAN